MAAGVPNVTVHGGTWGDPTFQMLAAALGLDRPADAIGRFTMLEHWCVSKRTAVVPVRMADLIMGAGGAEALVALGLATDAHEGHLEMGEATAAKVDEWSRKRTRDRNGGLARHEMGARTPTGRYRSGDDKEPSLSAHQAGAPAGEATSQKASPSQPSVSASASASSSASASTQNQNPPLPPKGGRPRKASKAQLTPEERDVGLRVLAAITERTGVAYQGSDHHLKLIAGRLRDGASYRDLRSVVAYCWHRSGLGWGEHADGKGRPMRQNLRPETLFGPEGIHRYLDAARDWFEREVRPRLTAEELAELGEAPTRAPPAPAAEPINVVPLRRVP